MSLLLTSQIKPILEELGLPDCTLSIKAANLVITGPCGQQLFTIPGFNQATIRKAEMPLVIELVTKFLNANIELIRQFFSLRQTKKSQATQFSILKEELTKNGKYSINHISYGSSPDYSIVKFEDFGHVVMTIKDFKITTISLKATADLKKTLKLIPELQKQMQQDLLFFNEMNAVNITLDEITKKLSSCTVY